MSGYISGNEALSQHKEVLPSENWKMLAARHTSHIPRKNS